jgi:hypothetical protein
MTTPHPTIQPSDACGDYTGEYGLTDPRPAVPSPRVARRVLQHRLDLVRIRVGGAEIWLPIRLDSARTAPPSTCGCAAEVHR